MTITVISTSTTTAIELASNSALDVLADVSIAVTGSGNAISTAFGNVLVNVNGYVDAGDDGFIDTSTAGVDQISIGQTGSLTGIEAGIVTLGGSSSIVNAGTIEGLLTDGVSESGLNAYISNSGTIIGGEAAIFTAGAAYITNSGTLESAATFGNTILENSGDDRLYNSGQILGNDTFYEIEFIGANNIIDNHGTIEGGETAINFDGGDDVLNNTGVISASKTAVIINSTSTNNGVPVVAAAGTITNSGTIIGNIIASDVTIVNSGEIVGNIQLGGTGNVYEGEHGFIDGIVYGSGANGVYYAGKGEETFDFISNGATAIYGGSGADLFQFSGQSLTKAVTIAGGSGRDTLEFTSAVSLTLGNFKHVSGLAEILLDAQASSVAVTDALVTSAHDGELTIDATVGGDKINLASITSASGGVTVEAGVSDKITAGGGTETFSFTTASASPAGKFDTVLNGNFANDYFDLPSAIQLIDPPVSASLSTATLGANLTTALPASALAAGSAVLVSATSGTLSGDTFLVINPTGSAGYHINSDLVINVTGATGTLSAANFV